MDIILLYTIHSPPLSAIGPTHSCQVLSDLHNLCGALCNVAAPSSRHAIWVVPDYRVPLAYLVTSILCYSSQIACHTKSIQILWVVQRIVNEGLTFCLLHYFTTTWSWNVRELLRCLDQTRLEIYLQLEMEWTEWTSCTPRSSELRDSVGSCRWTTSDMKLEARIAPDWSGQWKA